MAEPLDPALALWALAEAEASKSQHPDALGVDTRSSADPTSKGRLKDYAKPVQNPDSEEDGGILTTPVRKATTLPVCETPEITTTHIPQFTVLELEELYAATPQRMVHEELLAANRQNSQNEDDDGDITDSLLDYEERELRDLQRYFGSRAIFHTNPSHPVDSENYGAGSRKDKKSIIERASHLPRSQMHTAVGCCARTGRMHRFFYNLLVFLWIVIVYVIPGTVFFVLVNVLCVIPNVALIAADGAVALVIGSVILKAAKLSHYADPGPAAAIGALGAVLAILCIGAAFFWIPKDEKNRIHKAIAFPFVILCMTLAGVIGTSLLQKHGVNLGDTDVLHGARAGALGGLIIAPLMVTIGPMLFVALGILLTPLWIAMAAGLKWVWGRSNETWNGRWSSSSYCYTYGRCGADPEIDAEVEQFEAFAARRMVTHQPAWSSMNAFSTSMA